VHSAALVQTSWVATIMDLVFVHAGPVPAAFMIAAVPQLAECSHDYSPTEMNQEKPPYCYPSVSKAFNVDERLLGCQGVSWHSVLGDAVCCSDSLLSAKGNHTGCQDGYKEVIGGHSCYCHPSVSGSTFHDGKLLSSGCGHSHGNPVSEDDHDCNKHKVASTWRHMDVSPSHVEVIVNRRRSSYPAHNNVWGSDLTSISSYSVFEDALRCGERLLGAKTSCMSSTSSYVEAICSHYCHSYPVFRNGFSESGRLLVGNCHSNVYRVFDDAFEHDGRLPCSSAHGVSGRSKHVELIKGYNLSSNPGVGKTFTKARHFIACNCVSAHLVFDDTLLYNGHRLNAKKDHAQQMSSNVEGDCHYSFPRFSSVFNESACLREGSSLLNTYPVFDGAFECNETLLRSTTSGVDSRPRHLELVNGCITSSYPNAGCSCNGAFSFPVPDDATLYSACWCCSKPCRAQNISSNVEVIGRHYHYSYPTLNTACSESGRLLEGSCFSNAFPAFDGLGCNQWLLGDSLGKTGICHSGNFHSPQSQMLGACMPSMMVHSRTQASTALVTKRQQISRAILIWPRDLAACCYNGVEPCPK